MPIARCAQCALPLPSGAICAECMDRTPSYDTVVAAFPYVFPVDALVQAYKYGRDLTLAPLFARELARVVDGEADALVAMPLAASRLRERGFNQAHELARHLGRALDLPVLADACRKVADTPPQAGLTLAERVRNVRRAFVCDTDLSGMRVAIVDDVMTTGATVNELARVMKRSGAARVSAWVVARTLR
jgi:ComF family protein